MNFRILMITMGLLTGVSPLRLFAQVDTVTGLLATDCGNKGNAGDICVSFQITAGEDTIPEYRIMVTPEEMVGTFNLEAANLIEHYTAITPSDSIVSIQLEESSTDVNGNPIPEEEKYHVFVLCVAADTLTGQNTLSEPSNLLILSTPNYLFAGQTDIPPVHFVDPEPDITVVAEWDSSDEHYLDLNGDGTEDYRFYCYFSGAMASYTRSASISGTTAANRIISSQPVSNFLVNRFNYGDPLAFYDSLVSQQSYLSHYVYHDEPPDFEEGYWTGAEDRYAGLIMFDGSDTLIGWIKMSVPSYSDIVIKEYAWVVYSHHNTAAFTYEIKDVYEVQFTSLSSGESAVYWNFGDGTTSDEPNPSHVYSIEKDYQVVLKAYGLSGTDAASDIIHICEIPTASFTYDLSPWGHLMLFDQSEKAKFWRWDFGDGNSSTETSPEHYYQEDGIYPVTLIARRGACTDTTTTMVEVCIFPKAAFYYEIHGIEIYFYNTSLKADSLSWDFMDGSGSDLPDPVHSFNKTGEYNVVLHVYNDCGQDSVTHMVYVGTEELEQDAPVTLYPVPASDKLYIVPDVTCRELEAILYDPPGNIIRMLNKKTSVEPMMILDLKSVAEGIYFLKLFLDDHVCIRKIIIIK
ncbi:MAG: PKD domain-containing protein [Lentimicrobiaceae bacterium]|nr:PKD domain-containing protein [Lentimicrobiaceae bacterium]